MPAIEAFMGIPVLSNSSRESIIRNDFFDRMFRRRNIPRRQENAGPGDDDYEEYNQDFQQFSRLSELYTRQSALRTTRLGTPHAATHRQHLC